MSKVLHAAGILIFLVAPTLVWAQAEIVMAPPTAQQAMESLDKQEFDLSRALDAAQLDLNSAERRFTSTQTRFDNQSIPSDTLRDELAARRLQVSSTQRTIALLTERLKRVGQTKLSWQRLIELREQRFSPEMLPAWIAENAAALEGVNRQLKIKTGRLGELNQEKTFTAERRQALPATSESIRWLRIQERTLDQLIAGYQADISELETAAALSAELTAALDRSSSALPLRDRVFALLGQVREIWNYEITASDEQPITLGKLISAIIIFLAGYMLAGFVAKILGTRILPKIGLDRGAAYAFQSLTFYVLLLLVFLTALRTVSIPLTAFAVLGGALAIGVGFGSQNVVSNFMSGLILLAERPIKVGDLIEVDSNYGIVERIGLRSTRIRSGDNVHLILPNALFVENKIINWTHNDPKVRIEVSVGIAYGSETREAERLILQALSDNSRVHTHPVPVVLFRDFGDNALAFETRFWINMRTIMDRLSIESDVRFKIEELFRESGVVIAFPQRDVHIDSASPLQVRLLSSSGDSSSDSR